MTLLRSALFNLVFFTSTFFLTLFATAVSLLAPKRVLSVVVFWARVQLAAARAICGIRWKVTGPLPDGPALIASHHESAFDTLIWFILLPRPAYVLKQELTRIPLFGRLTRPAGMIAVDRSGGTASMRRLIRDAAKAVADRRQIVIFPEGTRAEPGTLLPLQPGVAALAASTGLPVIPVATDSGHCWSRRAFRKRPGVIHIALLPPIEPTTRRQDLLPRLEAAWRNGGAALQGAVDKSVG
ncbi:MAG TPA: lysophospholipid acyltransferase family protein [Acetobacteraceae bacterium]|jgi:1-acyl-sn-glycerol-3-phosphate acyltransferase|nr:lysophospholipid acyltransferase family protein [Acetobacteraceae bacterium]